MGQMKGMVCMTEKRSRIFTTRNMTLIAVLAAAASVLFLLEIPVIAFYKLDLSDLPVLLGAFSMGTVPGLVILALKCLIGLLHSSSAGIGELADFIMGAALVIPASLMYHRNKTRKTAVIGMAAGTLCMAVVSVFVNKWIMIPFYMGAYGIDMNVVLSMTGQTFIDSELKLLLLVTAPFNILKGVVISLVTGLIYKPLSPLLHGRR